LLFVRPLALAAVTVAASASVAVAQAPAGLPADTTRPVRLAIRGDLQLVRMAARTVLAAPGREGVLLIDSDLPTVAPALDSAITAWRLGRVRRVVFTHHHDEAAGGGVWFYQRGAEVLSSVVTRDRLAKRRDANGTLAVPEALPDRTFPQTFRFRWGTHDVELRPIAPAHTDGDVIAWFRPANVVHVGALVRGDGYPLPDLEAGGSVAGTLAVIERLVAECDDRTLIVPTYGPAMDRRTLREYATMLAAIRTRVLVQVRAGRSEDDVATSGLTGDYEPRWGRGPIQADRFLRLLYREVTSGRR
jgi:glyoxylase-like metal-dependent hydrolase (beta-lactamase superfamily II)